MIRINSIRTDGKRKKKMLVYCKEKERFLQGLKEGKKKKSKSMLKERKKPDYSHVSLSSFVYVYIHNILHMIEY